MEEVDESVEYDEKISPELHESLLHEVKNELDEINYEENGEENVIYEDPRYAVFSSDLIKIFSETIGISELSDDVLSGLAEDTSYRIRELIHHCSILMRNTKKEMLEPADIERVCQVMNIPLTYGYLTADKEDEYTYIPEADIFVVNDDEVDVVEMALADDEEYEQHAIEFAKGHWCMPEIVTDHPDNSDQFYTDLPVKRNDENMETETGEAAETMDTETIESTQEHCDSPQEVSDTPQEVGDSTQELGDTPQDVGDSPQDDSIHEFDDIFLDTDETFFDDDIENKPYTEIYCLQMGKTILSGCTELIEFALADLKTNPNLDMLTPYFINLTALAVNKIDRNNFLVDTLMSTIRALLENPAIDPSCFIASNRAVSVLINLITDPNVHDDLEKDDGYDLLLRARGAELLAKVLLSWGIEMKQQMDVVKQLLHFLLDKKSSVESQYGAVVGLIALGYRIIFLYFWPVMEKYLPILEDRYSTNGSSKEGPVIMEIRGAIMNAAELLYRKDWEFCSLDELSRRRIFDEMIVEEFGESIVPQRQLYRIAAKNYSVTVKTTSSLPKEIKRTRSKIVDFDFDHERWRPSYLIQKQPSFLQTRNAYNTNNSKESHNINSAFDKVGDIMSNEIIFNFGGSHQIDIRRLKRKVLDPRHIHYNSSNYKLSNLWYKQNIYKCTWTIRMFQRKSKTDNCSGDLHINI